MKKRLKSLIQKLQINFVPQLYKKRFFKNLQNLNWHSIQNKNIENELLLIKYFLDNNSTFIDIGANLGQYLYTTEKIVLKKNIHAFEPHPLLNQRLKKIFNGMAIHPYAVSKKNEKSQFKIPFFDEREIHTRGTLKTDYIDTSETTFKLINVEVVKLDSIIKNLSLKNISIIKIDVEGAEMDVIEGATECIREFQPILIIEIEQQHHTIPIISFISNIEQSGHYKCYYFNTLEQQIKGDIHEQNIQEIQSPSNHAKNRLFINNFIFLPLEKFDENRISALNNQIRADKNLH
jgi:FkbM family methyltransferase